MMHIVLISSSFPRHENDSQNAGVFVRQLAIMLTEAGHTVTVLTPQSVSDQVAPFSVRTIPWIGEETSLSHIEPRGPKNLARLAILMLSGMWRGAQIVRSEQPDRVIALWAVPSGLIALAARLITRTQYDVWALGSDIWRIDDYPFGRRILRRVLRGASRRFADGYTLANEVAAISQRPCEFLASSRLLPDVTLPILSRDPGLVELFCVARFHEHKGVDLLVKAVALLDAEDLARVHLTIRGGGPDEGLIRSLVQELGLTDTVHVGGYVDATSLSRFVQSSDLAIIPSRVESIPLVLSDFAQCDIPMIVTDTGDLGHIAMKFDAARVVPANDPDAIADGIRDFLSGLACGTSEGRARLSKTLNLQTSMERLTAF